MIGVLRWIDRNLWLIPLVVFLLAAASRVVRQQVYSSLTGSASALLGLALAAVAILVAFGPRLDRPGQPTESEARLATARTNIAGSLLTASFFLLVMLITATAALAVDAKHAGNSSVAAILEASGIASVLGLLVGGLGLALVIAERSRM